LASSAALQAERSAQFLRESDARQIITKVEDAARRQPLVFLGGALLLGAIAARFLKAAGNADSPANGQLAPASGETYAPSKVSPGGYTEGI
jgi:hypothetical protein